jgi:hypothetical protein
VCGISRAPKNLRLLYQRATAELIETALVETRGSRDQPETPSAIVVLHARAMHEVLSAVLLLCRVYCDAIPNMPEPTLRSLMERFHDLIAENKVT